MKALILAGGFGTRLRPISCTRPKTLFPIVNKPLLEGIFERLAKNSIKEVIMAVNGLTKFYIEKQRIQEYGLEITYSIDPPKKPLGTAGPIKNVENLIGKSDSFLVLNGDIFADINYKEIIKIHKEKQALGTIALYKVKDPTRYGSVEISDNNQITQFIEKPKKGMAPTNLINAGIYVLDPAVFQYIEKDKAVSMEREVFPILVEQKKLYGYNMQGLWMDIGKPAGYLQANKILLETSNKKIKYKKKNSVIKNPVSIDNDVKIGSKTIIGPFTVIGKNVSVGDGVEIIESVVFPDVEIQDYTKIMGAIIGEGVIIGKNVRINKGCIIGDYAKIRDNLTIHEGAAVCPGKELTENILKSNGIC
jgi:mannose-1-phosphate guanylyltransferase